MGNIISFDLVKPLFKYAKKYKYKIECSNETNHLIFDEPYIVKKFKTRWESVNYLRDLFDSFKRDNLTTIRNHRMTEEPYYFVIETIKPDDVPKRYSIYKCGYF